MAIQECGKGHLYDTEQHPSCPYCASGSMRIDFGIPAPPMTPPAPGMAPPAASDTIGKTMAPGMAPPAAPDTIGKTMAPGMAPPMTPPPAPGMAQPAAPAAIGKTMAPPPAPGMAPPMAPPPNQVGRTMAPVSSVPPVPPSAIGKTVAPIGLRRPTDDDSIGKTVGVFQRRSGCEPVVGWLVCTEGGEKGRDFRLLAKINTIGRSERMDVCLKNDPTISRENHARLAYDQKHNEFHLIPGDSSTVYLKDAPVYVPTKLQPYDLIEMGELKLMFVPFVGEHFSWDSSEEKQG